MRRLQRRDPAVLELERVAVRWKLGGEAPLREVEAGREPHVPAEARRGLTVEVEATLAPGARDDERLDEIALHAVEVGGLVVLVDEAERHEEQASPHRHGVIETTIDVELLHFELADIAGRAHGVLELVFGVELGALVEAVTDAEHRAGEIELRFLRLSGRVGVIDLAVAPQPQTVAEGVERGCARGGRRDIRERRGVRRRRRVRQCRCVRRNGACRRHRARRAGSCGRYGGPQFPEPALDLLLVLAERAILFAELRQCGLHLLQLLAQRLELRIAGGACRRRSAPQTEECEQEEHSRATAGSGGRGFECRVHDGQFPSGRGEQDPLLHPWPRRWCPGGQIVMRIIPIRK